MLTENHKLNISEFEDIFYKSLTDYEVFKFSYNHHNAEFIITGLYDKVLSQQSCSFTDGELAELTQKINRQKSFLEDQCTVFINVDLKNGQEPLRFIKKSTYSSRNLIDNGNLSQDMWDFLSAAYEAGINITINGPANSGKTLLLRYLYNNTHGVKRTIIGDIGAKNSATALHDDRHSNMFLDSSLDFLAMTSYRMRFERVVLDKDYSSTPDFLNFLPMFKENGISVVTSLTTESTKTPKRFELLGYMEIEVNVENRNGRPAVVESINQIVKENGEIHSRLLWNFNHRQVFEPSRKLRRDIANNSLKAHEIETIQKENQSVPAFKRVTPRYDMDLKKSHDTISTYLQGLENVPQDVQEAMGVFNTYIKRL